MTTEPETNNDRERIDAIRATRHQHPAHPIDEIRAQRRHRHEHRTIPKENK
ncbi:hypothetical protein [Microbacterium sp. LMC-P-041]|uniref:hypothetical protein n=1 Tax=Microbacterium sp. LMC-P-041 TaxID=3040293 RepID=UPI0025527CD1|nr:hypothetical protein [Microbacterium sp. LMC-P-041]